MEQPLAMVLVGSLVLYALLGGADYGAGFWDLVSSGPLKDKQKDLITNAIQPIWEANHVWLILMIVLLFAGFPRAFGSIMISLYVPILLMLLGIVLRGSCFVFRAYSTLHSRMRRTCAYVFSAASSFTPVCAGITVALLSEDYVVVVRDERMGAHLFDWLDPFSLCVGGVTLALFAYLAATYLAVEASSGELRDAFRRRALVAGVGCGGMALLAYILSGRYAQGFRAGLSHSSLAYVCEACAALSLLLGLVAQGKANVRLGRWMAVLFTAAMVVGWAVAQYPYLARPDRTIFNSVLSETVVRDVFFTSMMGAIVLFPSLGILLYIFKDQRRQRAIELAERS